MPRKLKHNQTDRSTECHLCGLPACSDPCRQCVTLYQRKAKTGIPIEGGFRRVQQAHSLIQSGTIDPTQPCRHLPGTVEKLAMLCLRAERQLPLYVAGDRTISPDELGLGPMTGQIFLRKAA